jgi:hypothetical protein
VGKAERALFAVTEYDLKVEVPVWHFKVHVNFDIPHRNLTGITSLVGRHERRRGQGETAAPAVPPFALYLITMMSQ